MKGTPARRRSFASRRAGRPLPPRDARSAGVHAGDEVILFLKGRAPAMAMPYGLSQGVYRVARHAGGAGGDAGRRGSGRRVVRGDPSRRPLDPEAFARQVQLVLTGVRRTTRSPRRAERPVMRRLLLVAIVCAWPHPPTRIRTSARRWQRHACIGPTRRCGGWRPIGAPRRDVGGLPDALARAFTTWQDVPTASIEFEFAGFTAAEPFDDDEGLSVIGFQAHPEMDRVLGATTFVFDEETGELIEADIFFNSAFEWSTAAGRRPGSVRSRVGGRP